VALDTAFSPRGNSYTLVATTTSSSVPIADPSGTGSINYRVVNLGAVDAFLAFAGSNDPAPVALIPVAGTPSTGMPVLARTVEVFTLQAGSQIAAITPGTTTTLYITVGEGL
jgi:hypothetical protein